MCFLVTQKYFAQYRNQEIKLHTGDECLLDPYDANLTGVKDVLKQN